MKSTWHPYNFDYNSRFENLSREWHRGFEYIYFAEHDNRYYLIYDGRLVHDFVVALADSNEEIEQIQNENFIQIIEFGDADARFKYRKENYPDNVVPKFMSKTYKRKKSSS